MSHKHARRTKEQIRQSETVAQNTNEVACERLTKLELFALKITDRVGSPGFFFIIFGWTVVWTGYNVLASTFPALGWKAFDPFPAFVAYLLISNVIQILLMPLIMVGQNLQSRHAEIRAENDYEVNIKAEHEIAELSKQVRTQQSLLEEILLRLSKEPDPVLSIPAERGAQNQKA